MGIQIPPWEGPILRRELGVCKVEGHSAVICTKMAEPIEMLFGLWARMSPRNHELDGVQIPHEKGQFSGKWLPTVKYRSFLP